MFQFYPFRGKIFIELILIQILLLKIIDYLILIYFSVFFERKVGVSGAHIITCASVITTTLLTIIAFEVGLNNHKLQNTIYP